MNEVSHHPGKGGVPGRVYGRNKKRWSR